MFVEMWVVYVALAVGILIGLFFDRRGFHRGVVGTISFLEENGYIKYVVTDDGNKMLQKFPSWKARYEDEDVPSVEQTDHRD